MKKKHPLRRILLSSVTTVSGVVLLLALKPTTAPFTSQAGGPAQQVPPVSAAASPAAPSPAGPDPSVPVASNPADGGGSGGTRDAGGQGGAPARKTVTGDAAQTSYGPVQVKITVEDGRIVSAAAVQAPAGTPTSDRLTATAVPELNRAAVTAQSARIDTVSGASFTSEGYRTSLQSALDKAGA
ncbi:FMN-binding protein [Actinacidiphila glaucinigra]|uniref:FMN-binding protein n=1 Tax=Actinacidiphila glaucinigra TaxID=235986 RepID=UPI002E3201EF|nr:FMN-binding protein [Actinacidiphila glaucinigra]